jgi:REP element-mobilizing transposase RayT
MTNSRRYDPERHRRQSIRKPDWDYSGPGRYFVTVCSFNRELIFGDIEDGAVRLSEIVNIVEQSWLEIADANPTVQLDAHILMPNHLHGIIIVPPNNWKQTNATGSRPAGAARGSLGAMLGRFKSTATRRANLLPNVGTSTLWQRGYHDRVIPDDALDIARQYIRNNPSNWLRDPDHPRHAHRQPPAPR